MVMDISQATVLSTITHHTKVHTSTTLPTRTAFVSDKQKAKSKLV